LLTGGLVEQSVFKVQVQLVVGLSTNLGGMMEVVPQLLFDPRPSCALERQCFSTISNLR
jgi:hypothetical protein